MAEAFQDEIRKELRTLRVDVEYIKEFLQDTRLTSKERKFVDTKIRKIGLGDKSDFISWKRAKKKLG